MKKQLLVAVLMLPVALLGRLSADDAAPSKCCGGSTCAASDSAGKSEIALKCPISGKAVSKDASVEYKGGKVYFSCAGCAPEFKENVAKYQAKANEQLVQSGQFKQVACPLTGGKVNAASKMKVRGVEVCFCCKNCQSKVAKADPAAQEEMVFVKGFDKSFALNKQGQESK